MKRHDFIQTVVRAEMSDKEQIRETCVNQVDNVLSKKRGIWVKRMVPAVACAAVVLAAVLIFPHMNNNLINGLGTEKNNPSGQSETNDNQGNKNPSIPNQTSEAEIVEIPNWDDMTITGKFSVISFDGASYFVNEAKINPSYIDKLLGKATSSGQDVYEDKIYSINCEVYSLKSISSKCAVAVKYEGYDGYYPFNSHDYIPATLSDLINDLNLRENLVFNKIYYSYWKDNVVANGNYITMEYTLPDTSVIWDLLLSDTSIKNAGDEHYTAEEMGISIDVKVIGYKNISLSVNADGYLQTNILGTGKSFFIGKDKVQAFMDYVLANGAGTVYGAGAKTEKPIPE